MKKRLLALTGLFLVWLSVSPQSGWAASPVCGPRAALLAQLTARYGEQPRHLGLAGNGSVLEVLTSSSGSWTILLTTPTGRSCLLAAGRHWQDRETPKLQSGAGDEPSAAERAAAKMNGGA